MMIYGTILIIFGVFIYKANWKLGISKKIYKYRAGIFSILSGGMMLIFNILKFELAELYTVFFHVGISTILLSFDSIYKKNECIKKVEAKYQGMIYKRQSKGFLIYIPKFKYTINNVEYIEECSQNFSWRFLEKNFVEGKEYSIYVNPNFKDKFIVKKELTFDEFFFFAIGIFMLIAPIPIYIL